MAYNNSSIGVKDFSAVWCERVNRQGKPTKYYSFTMEIGGSMYTCRVYSMSQYKPKSGKHQGKICCPVKVTKWEKTTYNNNW